MKITVIIPCYNSARWVGGAVESVLRQTRPADEIIVVDDGSSDDPASALAQFGEKVRLVRRSNGGLSAARNTGVQAAGGDKFLFLDADDKLFPDALEQLAETAACTGAGVVYGYVLQRNESGAKLHSTAVAVGEPPAPAKAAFWWTPIATAGCALIDRNWNDAVGGFDENFRQVEDAEYWLRCGVSTPFAHTGGVVLDKTYHPDSLGQRRFSSIWYRLQLQRKFLRWCRDRNIDTAFLSVTPQLMVDHVLKRAWHNQAWMLLDPLLDQAREMGVVTPWCIRARLKVFHLRLVGKLPERPSYCRNVWNVGTASP